MLENKIGAAMAAAAKELFLMKERRFMVIGVDWLERQRRANLEFLV